MKKKTPKKSDPGSVAVFDFAARRDFITGASKRKEQRRREAQEKLLEKQRQERRLLRAQRRERIREHINYVKRCRQLAQAAAETATSLGGKQQKVVGLDSLDKGASTNAKKHEGDAAEAGRRASGSRPSQTSEVVQGIRLLPPSANDASSSPWQIASCVSVSLGGFIEPATAATAAPAERAQKPLQTQSEASVSSKEKQLQKNPTSATTQVPTAIKKRPQGRPRGVSGTYTRAPAFSLAEASSD
ncbi:hypothetical protein, conserved [Eimeria praecox]|uniref:Nucleolar protein 12 n=1 Tax=Eimeria praecox TaxID=51316 RepID=U6H3E7_9EIME|nr:hypothetical protein, conserved [Eimeria praecox]